MSAYIMPTIIAAVLAVGAIKRVDLVSAFCDGAKRGIKTSISVLPSLILLMTCVGMFKASGGLELIANALTPFCEWLHIPKEVVPLGIIRPISGSGGMAVFQGILAENGADSMVGRIASVLMGSSETTFYTIAVYYGACSVKNARHTLVCALAGDITAFFMSTALVMAFFAPRVL